MKLGLCPATIEPTVPWVRRAMVLRGGRFDLSTGGADPSSHGEDCQHRAQTTPPAMLRPEPPLQLRLPFSTNVFISHRESANSLQARRAPARHSRSVPAGLTDSALAVGVAKVLSERAKSPHRSAVGRIVKALLVGSTLSLPRRSTARPPTRVSVVQGESSRPLDRCWAAWPAPRPSYPLRSVPSSPAARPCPS
jgi:hypothetical protein